MGAIVRTVNIPSDAQKAAMNAAGPTPPSGDNPFVTAADSAASLDALTDVDTTGVTVDQVLKYNGSEWVPAAYDASFAFSVASISDGQAATQLVGSGVWKAAGALTFTVAYNNGPATGAYIDHAGWNTSLTLLTPFTSGVSEEDTPYPSPGASFKFQVWAVKAGGGGSTLETYVVFANHVRWGTSTKTDTYLESDIEDLASNAVSNTKGRSITVTALTGNYIIYALPVRLGTVTFWVGGFEGGFEAPETVSVTNSAGYTEDYYVYRSTNSGLGATTVTVV